MSRVADPKAKIMLLRAAEEVFALRGVDGAKVEDITKRVGLSKGAFYLHFESKEAAAKQVVESFLARCGAFFGSPSEYPSLPEDPDELLDFTIERDIQIYEFLWQNRAILQILGSCRGEYDYLVEAFRAEIDEKTRAWVDHWRAEGLFRDEVDAILATVVMSGAYHELSLRLVRNEKRPAFEDWLSFAQDTFVRAYGSPELMRAQARRNQRVSSGIGAVARRRAGGDHVRSRRD